MKPPIQYADFVKIYDLARKLALALADEAVYLEGLVQIGNSEGPSESSLQLLMRARDELDLAKQFDELDGLKTGVWR